MKQALDSLPQTVSFLEDGCDSAFTTYPQSLAYTNCISAKLQFMSTAKVTWEWGETDSNL